MSVVIETTIGDITVDLFTEERPVACLNFMKLCKLKYFNFNLFHTVEQGFIAQTGDPTGVGDGGSSVWGVVEGLQKRFFEAETLPKINHTSAGLLSLVSAGKNLVGSQFFFTLADSLTSLDGIHCVIGEVVEGNETLRKLNDAIVDEKFRPYQDIRITHTVILDDPFPNPRGFQIPSRSPSPSAKRLQNGRIAADEDIDDTDGKTTEELQEMLSEREAKARATILEIVGDLPDAEMAPPENVLFVCKLNPVTTDDDLEIIFSRFGVVKNCEVIRDRKTGDSLQYAFVEFEEQKSCEAAFFKMDNVLIDDRRIHVDFSQSVAKVKWRGKGRGVMGQEGRLDFSNLRENNEERRERHGRRSVRDEKRPKMEFGERQKARENRHREQRLREESRGHRYDRQRQRDHVRSRRSRSRNLSLTRNIETRDRSPFRKDERRFHQRHQNIERHDVNRNRSRHSHYTPERRRASLKQRHSTERREYDKDRCLSSGRREENEKEAARNLKHDRNTKRKSTKSNRSKATSSEDSSSSLSSCDGSSSSSESDSSSDSSPNGRRKSKKSQKLKTKIAKSKTYKKSKPEKKK